MGTGDGRPFPMEKALLVPPGFVSQSSFNLERQQTEEAPRNAEAVPEIPCIFDDEKLKKDWWRRIWLHDRQITPKPKENDSATKMNLPVKARLPKGVTRGCSRCPNCVKVISCWRPEEPHRPVLEEAPVFHPTEEEFKETLKYVASIREKAETIGMCRIVPPPSWKPPNLTRENNLYDNLDFETSIQKVHELQRQFSRKKRFRVQEERPSKRRKGSSKDKSSGVPPKLTLKAYEKYADDFKSQYFCKKEKSTGWVPSVEDVEGEYWRIVEHPSEKIEVLQSSHVESGVPSTEFPVNDRPSETSGSGWNLNNTFKVRGSLLCYENEANSAFLRPHLSAGMCFSSVCWKVEKHHLYSLCYAHLGNPKIWYVIPGKYCYKFASFVKKHFPESRKHPELYRKMPHFSPSSLIGEGIPVYRCVQQPGEFVVIFPGAYNSQFDCGFSCSESVSFAPFDWLPTGQQIVELYSEQHMRTSISVDKMLLRAAGEAVWAQWQRLLLYNKNLGDQIPWETVCGNKGVLTKVLQSRVKEEAMRVKYLCKSLQSRKMAENFDLHVKQECSICFYDLHLSAIGCPCSPDKYTCTRHGMELCSCPWTDRYLLSRYSIDELNLLVEALEGKLDSVFKWGREKLGLKLNSSYLKNAVPIPSEAELPALRKVVGLSPVSPDRRKHTVARVSRAESEDGGDKDKVVSATRSPKSNSSSRKGERKNCVPDKSAVIVIDSDSD